MGQAEQIEWMVSSETAARVNHVAGGGWRALAALTDRLAAGAIRAQARRAIISIDGNAEDETHTDWPVPSAFWKTDVLDSRATRWAVGDFLSVEEMRRGLAEARAGSGRRYVQTALQGVRFCRADVDGEFPPVSQDDPLDLWLALEVRHARIAFCERKAEDDHYVEVGHRKGGARIKLILRWMEKIAVPLTDAVLGRATAFQSSPEALERARAKVGAFVKEMGEAALQMAAFVGGERRSVRDETRVRIDALLADVDGAFRLAALPPTAPPSRPASSATEVEGAAVPKRPPHRPRKSPQALEIFAKRLREGSTCQNKTEEGRRIAKAWGGSDPATPDSIAGWISPFHQRCQWDEGKVRNGASIAAAVEAEMRGR